MSAVHPGKDGKVRAVDVITNRVNIPDPKLKRLLSLDHFKVKTTTLSRPITKLALLIPQKKMMKNPEGGLLHSGEDVGAMAGELQEDAA